MIFSKFYIFFSSVIASIYCFSLGFFLVTKKHTDEQIAPNTATISKTNVAFSPVSASPTESFIPRKFTVSSVIGSLVPAEKTTRLSC